MEEDLTDEALLKAVRRRLLAEMEKGDAERIVNNVYNTPGGGHGDKGGGIFDQLANSGGEDPLEYYVDIERRNVADPENPEKSLGWDKRVRRYAKKKA